MIEFTLPLPILLALVSGTVLPLLVGLVTKRVTHSGVKATLLAALAAVSGLTAELLASLEAGTSYDIGVGLLTALGAFLVGVGMHAGLYKPTKAAESLQNVGGPKAGYTADAHDSEPGAMTLEEISDYLDEIDPDAESGEEQDSISDEELEELEDPRS